jgi:RNA polymerase sigma factor (sigma-70 family)
LLWEHRTASHAARCCCPPLGTSQPLSILTPARRTKLESFRYRPPDFATRSLRKSDSGQRQPQDIRTPQHLPPHADQTRWFAENVQPHERDLRAFLHRRFPSLRDIDDLVQETYARLFDGGKAGEITEPRAYLFATARNAALDLLRKKHEVLVEDIEETRRPNVVEERPDSAESASRSQEHSLILEAIQALPSRCRDVLTLRKIHGLSYRDVATRLGITESTVNAQLAIGVVRCRNYLETRGIKRGGSDFGKAG